MQTGSAGRTLSRRTVKSVTDGDDIILKSGIKGDSMKIRVHDHMASLRP